MQAGHCSSVYDTGKNVNVQQVIPMLTCSVSGAQKNQQESDGGELGGIG